MVGAKDNRFGISVELPNYALVGAHERDENINDNTVYGVDAIYVFVCCFPSQFARGQQKKSTDPNGRSRENLGNELSISELVSQFNDDAGFNTRAALIFRRDKVTEDNPVGFEQMMYSQGTFRISCAIDGDTVVVGYKNNEKVSKLAQHMFSRIQTEINETSSKK